MGSADFHKRNQNNCGLTESFHKPANDGTNSNAFIPNEVQYGILSTIIFIIIISLRSVEAV